MSERLEVSFPGRKRVDVRVRGFEIATDQSVKAGGEASVPQPFHLFLSSMAACAGFYALNFCQSRTISAAGLGLSMLWERDEKRPLEARARLHLTLPRPISRPSTGKVSSGRWSCARSRNTSRTRLSSRSKF